MADGYRPPMVPSVPPAVAMIIERCWKGSSGLRPSARSVVVALEHIQESGELRWGRQGWLWLQ